MKGCHGSEKQKHLGSFEILLESFPFHVTMFLCGRFLKLKKPQHTMHVVSTQSAVLLNDIAI